MDDRFNISNNNNNSSVSDYSENSSDGLPSHSHGCFLPENKICRDFMRNACNRGNACRFRHPDNEETRLISDDSNPKEIIFCHDFQNNICKRNDCRFIHCTREDENTYKITGLLPKSLSSSLASEKKPPICLDFNKGFCKRGDRCKYRHICNYLLHGKDVCDIRKKRKCVDDYQGKDLTKKFLSEYQLAEENHLLRRRVDDLERQLSVLVASNELLLEQNARYRSCKLITVPPIVAVSQMLTPTITPTPISIGSRPVTALHHQTPHGITTMATLSIGNQREFVLPQSLSQPPPLAPQQSLPSQAPTVDQPISMTIAPLTIETLPMPPCSNLSNSTLSQQQQQQTIAAALSLSMPHLSHASLGSLIGNSNLVSYPLISHARLPTSSLG